MNKIKAKEISVGGDTAYVTLAGAAALATPLPMKDFITNTRRDNAGKEYLLSAAHKDDLQVSVQFISYGDSLDQAVMDMEANIALLGGGIAEVEITGYGTFIYKSTGSVTPQGNGEVLLYSLNLIKLAEEE